MAGSLSPPSVKESHDFQREGNTSHIGRKIKDIRQLLKITAADRFLKKEVQFILSPPGELNYIMRSKRMLYMRIMAHVAHTQSQ